MLMEATAVASQTGLLEHARKSAPSPFLLKTYTLVNDSETDGFISWNEDGTGFVVWKPAEFAQNILPTFFKHSNFSSFIRQLNTYGFRKVATDRWEFCNDNFLRDQKELLFHIRRRKAWTSSQQPTANQANAIPKKVDEDQRSSSTSSDSDYGILMEENKRLKMENGVLSSELMSTNRKCQQLLELVAKDGLLEKLDQKESERPPMLFGVRLDIQGNSKREKMLAEIRQNVSNLLSQSCK